MELTEAQMLENWLNGCWCPAEWVEKNQEKLTSFIDLQPGCTVHSFPQENTGEHVLHKLEDDPYIHPEEVPPPVLPDPAHHVFFTTEELAGIQRVKDAADRAWEQHHSHRGPKPVRGWDPTRGEWRTVLLILVLIAAVFAGMIFYPGW